MCILPNVEHRPCSERHQIEMIVHKGKHENSTKLILYLISPKPVAPAYDSSFQMVVFIPSKTLL